MGNPNAKKPQPPQESAAAVVVPEPSQIPPEFPVVMAEPVVIPEPVISLNGFLQHQGSGLDEDTKAVLKAVYSTQARSLSQWHVLAAEIPNKEVAS